LPRLSHVSARFAPLESERGAICLAKPILTDERLDMFVGSFLQDIASARRKAELASEVAARGKTGGLLPRAPKHEQNRGRR
jgi:hypothetical protein